MHMFDQIEHLGEVTILAVMIFGLISIRVHKVVSRYLFICTFRLKRRHTRDSTLNTCTFPVTGFLYITDVNVR